MTFAANSKVRIPKDVREEADRHSNQRDSPENWDAGHLNYAFLGEQSITEARRGKGWQRIEAARWLEIALAQNGRARESILRVAFPSPETLRGICGTLWPLERISLGRLSAV